MLPLAAFFLLLSGDFTQFLSELKRNPPACDPQILDFPVHRPAVWSEHYGPKLVADRTIQLAPGVAFISGKILEIGPPFGFRSRPVRIVAGLHHRSWTVHHAECGPAPASFVITRLTQ